MMPEYSLGKVLSPVDVMAEPGPGYSCFTPNNNTTNSTGLQQLFPVQTTPELYQPGTGISPGPLPHDIGAAVTHRDEFLSQVDMPCLSTGGQEEVDCPAMGSVGYVPGVGNRGSVGYVAGVGNRGFQSPSLLAAIPSPLASLPSSNFTFTVPTQASIGVSMATMHQPRYVLTSRATPQTFAPGVGSPWQHSVPTRLAWLQSSAPMTVAPNGVSVFTAPLCSVYSPVPSCSNTPRRPKRHATENIDLLGPSSKIHLTEEKIAKHLEELKISSIPSPPPTTVLDSMVTDQVQKNDCTAQQWADFHNLEERLEMSEEEEEPDIVKAVSRRRGPKVHMLENLRQVTDPQSIIPKHVLEEIAKPRMEIVLWKPPGGMVKQVISSNSATEVTATDTHRNHHEDSKPDLLKDIGISDTLEDGMEEDTADGVDSMQLD